MSPDGPHHKWVVCRSYGCKYNNPSVMRIGARGCYSGHTCIKEVEEPKNPASPDLAKPCFVPGELLEQIEAWGELLGDASDDPI
jgi:hypothetical protein